MNFRSPSITVGLSPIIRRDLRHAVQVNRTLALHDSAFDSCRMVPHAWTSRTASSLNFRFQANLDFGLGEAVIINRRLLPGMPGWLRSTDNRKTRFDLRHALDCDLICRDQQNASAICSCNSPLRAATRVFPFGNIGSIAISVSS